MGPAELAIFLHLQPILHGPLVLGRCIIPLLAVRTGQDNDISHDNHLASNGAHDQDRTGDLILTKDVLYRLSYVGWFPVASAVFPPPPIRIKEEPVTHPEVNTSPI
jgi:hypothetical protein